MSDDRLTKDDLSEYLVKLQKLQRLCTGTYGGFEISLIADSIFVRYTSDQEMIDRHTNIYLSLSTATDRDSAATIYNELLRQLKKDNWL